MPRHDLSTLRPNLPAQGLEVTATVAIIVAMQEPNLRASRRTLAGLLAAGVLVAGAGFYLGRSTSSEPDREAPAKAPVTPAPTASALVESRTLGRGDIIALAAAAADATTSGTALPEGVREAIGRRVEVALPFGCSGPSPDDSDQPLRWRYDENEETLRLHVAVERWAPSDWGLAQPSLEEANGDEPVIEGFWVARPWTSSTECPVQSVQAGTVAAQALATDAANAANSLAIAQFLSGGGRRAQKRRGAAWRAARISAGRAALSKRAAGAASEPRPDTRFPSGAVGTRHRGAWAKRRARKPGSMRSARRQRRPATLHRRGYARRHPD